MDAGELFSAENVALLLYWGEQLDELFHEEQILFKQYQLLVHPTEANDVVDGPGVLLVDLKDAVKHQEVRPPSYMSKNN